MGDALMEKFKWGRAFYDINRELFERYSACRDSADIVKLQADYMKELEEQWVKDRESGIDLPDMTDSEDEFKWETNGESDVDDDEEDTLKEIVDRFGNTVKV